jgi:hypothetical protein
MKGKNRSIGVVCILLALLVVFTASAYAGDDPYATIANQVRADSMVYPQPTNVEIFRSPVFGIGPGHYRSYAWALLWRPGYGDIVQITVPETGASYFYSNRYLNRDLAWALARSAELDQYENP